MERNSHCGLIRVCLWGANTELPPFRSSQVSKQFYLWSKFHPDITPCGRKQSPSNPPIPGSSHCWGLALHTQVNAGKRWWEIVLYYRQWFELMGIPLRVFFFESEPKTKRFDPCPAIMSFPGARKWETIVIVLGLQDPLPRSLEWESDLYNISVSGLCWLWEGENDEMWELKFS